MTKSFGIVGSILDTSFVAPVDSAFSFWPWWQLPGYSLSSQAVLFLHPAHMLFTGFCGDLHRLGNRDGPHGQNYSKLLFNGKRPLHRGSTKQRAVSVDWALRQSAWFEHHIPEIQSQSPFLSMSPAPVLRAPWLQFCLASIFARSCCNG